MLIFVYMRIGELSNKTDTPIQTIRYYERIKLISKPKTTESGYRLYTDDYANKLGFIKVAKECGFTLKEIQVLLKMNKCSTVNKLVSKKLKEINNKINLYNTIKLKLLNLLEQCPNESKLSDCTILKSFYKNN